MRLQIELSERFYRIFERGAKALELIAQTMQSPPEDFTEEDQILKRLTKTVHDAQDRIPHRATNN
jgi:hypothetical protein